MKKYSFLLLLILAITACDKTNNEPDKFFQLLSAKVGTQTLNLTDFTQNNNISLNQSITLKFSAQLDSLSAMRDVKLMLDNVAQEATISFRDNRLTCIISPNRQLTGNKTYAISIPNTLVSKGKDKFKAVDISFTTQKELLQIDSVVIDGQRADIATNKILNAELSPTIRVYFNKTLNPQTINANTIKIVNAKGVNCLLTLNLIQNNKAVEVVVNTALSDLMRHSLFLVAGIAGVSEETFDGQGFTFFTKPSDIPKFAVITDDELLTLVQQRTFRFFWDYAHPTSGLTRERTNAGDVVTIGGSGFGVMAIVVGVERGFITRTQAVDRLTKIVDFLTKADRFHGVWSHWLNGSTGKVVPFGTNDNGGDLVETSYMAQGLLTVRQYLKSAEPKEAALIDKINTLLDSIEWTWYNRTGQNILTWHWSPNLGWVMNMHVRGYNEALITYFMAATSQKYPIEPIVYHNGWAGTSYFKNGKKYYGITLPLGFEYGGPLFFAHYSFLGLDPRDLSDKYANYWTQNVNHTLINRQYCITNPKKYVAYGENCWGLTASDEPSGYGVHEPTRDNGVISPTAALSSFPYTPTESMQALKFFYYKLGDRVWGEYGFCDAFSIETGWYASSYLAIDQGPIILMIENHRTGLLWDLFMSAPEVSNAKKDLGFN